MLHAHQVSDVRAAEQATGELLTSGVLMQRAAGGLAAICLRRLRASGGVYGAPVLVLAGSGDNGGDALYAGARLARRGAVVQVLSTGRLHEGGAAAVARAGGQSLGDDVPDETVRSLFGSARLVLDGLVGIGAQGPLRAPAARLAALHAEAGAVDRTVAVDVPSGVDAATGAVTGPVLDAAVTVTFGAIKPGLLLLPGSEHVGELQLVPIGLELPRPDLVALEHADVADRLPSPGGTSSKYTRGVVGLAAGSERYPGAAVLSAGAARHGGAGYVRFVSTAHPAEQVRLRFPSIVVTEVPAGDTTEDAAARAEQTLAAGRVQAWAVGSGLGTDAGAAAVVRAVLAEDLPVLLDADALSVVAVDRPMLEQRHGRPTLLTPHEGEFLRLLGGDRDEAAAALAADRLATVRKAAAELGVTVLLKGSTTLVVAPDGTARVNRTGSGWLATAGSGDVLTGLCGALLASGLDPLDAGSVGAHLHGLAGELAPVPTAADDVLAALPAAWAAVARAARHGGDLS